MEINIEKILDYVVSSSQHGNVTSVESTGTPSPKMTKPRNAWNCTFQNQTVQCKICNKSLSNKSLRLHHRRIHEQERTFKCESCDKAFFNRSGLKQHSVVHTGERRFRCELCLKRFGHQHSLDYHIRVHTGEVPYKCDICNKAFSRPDYRNIHRKSHLGENQFSYGICNQTFTTNRLLQRRQLVHKKEKFSTCLFCTKKCRDFGELNNHMRKHTMEAPYNCQRCNSWFRRPNSLRLHQLVSCKHLFA